MTYSTYRRGEKYLYRVLFGKCVGMESENRCEDKWILVKFSVRMWTGFSCLSIVNTVINCGFYERQEIS